MNFLLVIKKINLIFHFRFSEKKANYIYFILFKYEKNYFCTASYSLVCFFVRYL